jgi:hypothetical protein
MSVLMSFEVEPKELKGHLWAGALSIGRPPGTDG